jgi:iodotyrosine deiodinase
VNLKTNRRQMKIIGGFEFVPYEPLRLTEKESLQKSRDLLDLMQHRRSVREFSDQPVSEEIIRNIILTASTAPSGANKQPWSFCVVTNPIIKSHIRQAAEKEEYENYHGRMSEEWVENLKPLQTDWSKPFIETAPYLIVVFKKIYNVDSAGEKRNNYYVNESVGIACGLLLTAIQNAGLAALTHTPSPMNFLIRILNRPENEKPFLLIPVGYPAEGCHVPSIRKKSVDEVISYYT